MSRLKIVFENFAFRNLTREFYMICKFVILKWHRDIRVFLDELTIFRLFRNATFTLIVMEI